MSLNKELELVVLQYLNDQNYTETAHKLEKEASLYFDMMYLEDLVMAGKFDEAEGYLLGFTNLEDNVHSTMIFFEIRKQKFLEALDQKDRFKAVKILRDDIKVFRNITPEVYTEMAELVTLDNFSENKQLEYYRDTQTQRIAMFKEIKRIVQLNPMISHKLMLPSIPAKRLPTLINQSFNWQHMTCETPQPIPDIKTLFVDHTCGPSTGALTTPPVNNNLFGGLFRPIAMNAHAAVTFGADALRPLPNAGALLQQARTPPTSNSGIVYASTDSARIGKVDEAALSNLVGPANTSSFAPCATQNSEKIPAEVSRVSMVDVKQRLPGEGGSKNSKFAELIDPDHCRSIRLIDPDQRPTGKIVRLLYTHSGSVLLALDSNAVHKQWKWPENKQNPSIKATTNVQPQFWKPPSNILIKNDTSDINLEEVVPCMALSKNDKYVLSASGGKVSLFEFLTSVVIKSYMLPPLAATCLAFYPLDNNIIAIGMDDSTIQIFSIQLGKVNMLLWHETKITGLAFSEALNVLVSSAADSKLCVWNVNGWEKCKSKSIHSQEEGKSPSPLADTTVQFDNINKVKLLVVQESLIAIYDASELECVCHWEPRDPMPARISSATYSCDSLLVYASFFDGSVGVFEAELLRPRCRIALSAFIPRTIPTAGSDNTYPFVIAAHPHQPNQIAVGLTDGSVHVIEPAA